MHQSKTRSDNAVDVDAAPDAIVDALHDVVSDFDTFVADWCERLAESIAACDAPQTQNEEFPNDELREELGNLQQEKSHWESTRNGEAVEIQDKAQQLTDAWLRLESEQRKFLQMTATHPHAAREINAASETSNRDSLAAAPATNRGDAAEPKQTSNGGQDATERQSTRQSPATKPNASREAACQQFKRLKREIDSSRPKSS